MQMLSNKRLPFQLLLCLLTVAVCLFAISCTAQIVTVGKEAAQNCNAESFETLSIPRLIASYSPLCKQVIDNAHLYEVQILYTHVEHTDKGEVRLHHFSYRVDPNAYFNPASLVKLPVACLALQRLHELNIAGLDKDTPLSIGASHRCQTPVHRDPSSPSGMPSIGLYVKKALIVSDNEAYNRLYEFLGQDYINTTLFQMGYTARIIRRFSRCSADDNRFTNPFTFYTPHGSLLYSQPMLINPNILRNPLGHVLKGRGHIDEQGRFVPHPFDYETHNYLSLVEIHTMLQTIIFPDLFPNRMRFKLSPDDYAFVRHALSCLPRESGIPLLMDSKRYPDNHKKYFLFGDVPAGSIADRTTLSYNIVGRSDGYLSESAYIINQTEHIEFFLSAVIYVNDNGIIKDNTYQYKEIGIPFLAQIGKAFFAYEQQLHSRKVHP